MVTRIHIRMLQAWLIALGVGFASGIIFRSFFDSFLQFLYFCLLSLAVVVFAFVAWDHVESHPGTLAYVRDSCWRALNVTIALIHGDNGA